LRVHALLQADHAIVGSDGPDNNDQDEGYKQAGDCKEDFSSAHPVKLMARTAPGQAASRGSSHIKMEKRVAR
jgi:hypothetical protein